MEERIQELEIQLKYLQEVQAGSAQGNAELSEDGPVPNTVALERERVVYLQQDRAAAPAARRRQRDQRYKSQVHDPGLKEGQLVYTRNHSVKGRNKIQDTWDSTPYRVVQQPDHQGAVYSVIPASQDGPVRRVHRTELRRVPGEEGIQDRQAANHDSEGELVEDEDDPPYSELLLLETDGSGAEGPSGVGVDAPEVEEVSDSMEETEECLQSPTEAPGEKNGASLVVGKEETTELEDSGVNKQETTLGEVAGEEGDPAQQLLQQAKGLSGYIYNFATSATKKISDSVTETAQTIKKSVEEGKIDGIIDKTILGDFQKEQEKFVLEKNAKKTDAAVPPWVGYSEEETIQQQILALSADRRNFLRDPPAGVQFHFDFEQMYPIALVMLQEDELLNRMRFDLVPKHVKEDVFWRNYFYRVSLIKQSAQLTALAAQQQAAEKKEEEKSASSPETDHLAENIRPKTPPMPINSKPKSAEEEEEISTSPGVSEFVSDAFDSCNINQEDLRKEMEQLVLDKTDEASAQEEETADWEKELQQELQEYEVVAESENRDDNWDKEIEEMLQADS
ncbi:hypothetical protein AAFF_G00278150 [Aldrovandia affinis]|uniref:Synapse-associated protein 1 n=1 Tax=Aldrovandia affinis TaxID=143900 RepID=A0AAD7SSY8_9TELE|nr:hypothetical protein AAFF_G00278150 [Aldrovandia affinis]